MSIEMNEKLSANRDESKSVDKRSIDRGDVSVEQDAKAVEQGAKAKGDVPVDHGTKKLVQADLTSKSAPPGDHRSTQRRRLLLGVLGVLVLAVVSVFGIPWIRLALSTVSTDDAYVNGHVTFVAPRVHGQVSRVLVDDNNRVHKGDVLVELDKEPFRDAVAVKKAAVDTAQADLQAASAAVRGIEAQARSRRWQLQEAVENVDNQVALLHARVAALKKAKATLTLAQEEFDRTSKLVVSGTATRELYDERQATLSTAQAGVVQALADVNQIRVSLGLQVQPEDSGDLDQVPPDLNETFSAVLQAQADLIQTAAELGVLHSYNQSPKQMLEEFEKSDQGDIDRTFDRLAAEAPAVKQAEAKLEAAKRDLALAELDVRYCDVVADIDGVVTRRNVNPGNDVQVGQSLMAIRSLSEIWIDANFKETQLHDLRIGQAADLYVDMYGDRQVFKGRISGFTMGTGSTLALLPAENATGNFVKIVQRLPVRIELEGYDPDQRPLFVGTSVTPYIYINKPPTGPDAGKFLQGSERQSSAPASAASSAGVEK
jgi:membrane fusion protein, multidrug efflux system